MARQKLGQHFLQSEHILERIAVAACGDHAGTVIEIGPGNGALTEHLLRRVDRLIAIELDQDLAAGLRLRWAAEPRLTIVRGDALNQDFAIWEPEVICGNLPYYVATPILARAVRSGAPCVALIQKEVASRIAARPGSTDYGFLTCEIGLFAEPRLLFTVKPGSFRPPPKVDSAVIRLTPRALSAELQVDPDAFLRFLSACFRHKRKTLRNNLAEAYPVDRIERLSAGSLRAEQCSLEELAAIYRDLLVS